MKKPAWMREEKRHVKPVKTQRHKHQWTKVSSEGHGVYRCRCGEVGFGVPA